MTVVAVGAGGEALVKTEAPLTDQEERNCWFVPPTMISLLDQAVPTNSITRENAIMNTIVPNALLPLVTSLFTKQDSVPVLELLL